MGCALSHVSPANADTRQSTPANPACIPVCGTVPKPDKRAKITGCTFLPTGYLILVDNSNKRIKLFDLQLKCRSYIDLDFRPFEVSAKDRNVYVTIPKEKLVQKFTVTLSILCMKSKLLRRSTFPTEGECSGIVAYSDRELIISMKFSTYVNADMTDASWQVQLVSTTGEVKRRFMHSSEGLCLFYGAKYLALTPDREELVISEGEDNRVKCLDLKSGELTFNHHMEDPRGIVCDKNNNIYVLGKHGTIRWVMADRAYIKELIKGERNVLYADALGYHSTSHKLAIPRNENKIEMYKIRNSITDDSDL